MLKCQREVRRPWASLTWKPRSDAHEPVMAWFRQVRAADWATPANVKRAVRSVSILGEGRAVSGVKYRIEVWINYPIRRRVSGRLIASSLATIRMRKLGLGNRPAPHRLIPAAGRSR
jgi:mRNA-degrading endonuclease HigB of HigAB toxin-antitoxin module